MIALFYVGEAHAFCRLDRGRPPFRKLRQRLYLPSAARAIDSFPCVVLPRLQETAALVRQHSGRQLYLASRAMPLVPQADLSTLPPRGTVDGPPFSHLRRP